MADTDKKPLVIQLPQLLTSQLPASITPQPSFSGTPQPSGTYGQSMFSVMQGQQGDANMRTTILVDLFRRLKDKTMYLQNITLGDEQISASLSRLYQSKCTLVQSKCTLELNKCTLELSKCTLNQFTFMFDQSKYRLCYSKCVVDHRTHATAEVAV